MDERGAPEVTSDGPERGPVTVQLTRAEALVFFDWSTRVIEMRRPGSRGRRNTALFDRQ